MLADTNNERPTLAESYAGAVSTGNSRVEPHKFSHADLIASAGMSPYRMGTALMRLVSEWNSGAVPRQGALPDVKVLAQQLAVQRVRDDEIDHATMKVSEKRAKLAAAAVTKADMELAHAEYRRLQARATDWSLEESKLRFQRLKTLPAVRAALECWVLQKGWVEDGWNGVQQLVAGVLQYFLSPHCPTCGGSGVREFAGNNRRGAGKPCWACKSRKDAGQIKVMGEMPIPGHGRGRAMLQYLTQCTGQAAADLREGAHRLRRSSASTEARKKRRDGEKAEQLRRADVEAEADGKQDRAAVAEHFKNSMANPRKRATR